MIYLLAEANLYVTVAISQGKGERAPCNFKQPE